MKKLLIIGALIVVVLIILLSGGSDENGSVGSPLPEATPSVEPTPGMSGAVISYTADGFSPATVTLKKGDKVTFKNNSSAEMWPASGIHPLHRLYPGSDIAKCGTAEEAKIFDACRGITPGSSYSFIFSEVGTWKYHNHLNVSKFGTIVVEE